MKGLDVNRLVLIESTIQTSDDKEKFLHGTGYFVTNELVLTAGHVLSEGTSKKIEVFVGKEDEPWREAELEPVWLDKGLDAALIKVTRAISEVELPDWRKDPFQNNVPWNSVAYPKASTQRTGDGTNWQTSGLVGELNAHGGLPVGPGLRELDLTVDAPPDDRGWEGISGAPVFVNNQLVGLIKSYPEAFNGQRLAGVPIDLLLKEPSFKNALVQPWLKFPSQKTWFLVLISEQGDTELTYRVRAAVTNHIDTIKRITELPVDDELCVVPVLEGLESPERWSQLIQALCVAPVVVADVTGFQPAIMLLLGIRAVVRRGVTITTLAKELDETLLSKLPFNIQEIKLIDYGDYDIHDPRHQTNKIGEAIKDGLALLNTQSAYLDLPVYDSVRCPKPELEPKHTQSTAPTALNSALMLCSFHEEYKKHWSYVSTCVDARTSPSRLVRMVDISSPRVVGQALYEYIRWTTFCIVDWTHWRANVFFELGVRLASSDLPPICLIEKNEIGCTKDVLTNNEAVSSDSRETVKCIQRALLIRLFNPKQYELKGPTTPFDEAFQENRDFIKNRKQSSIREGSLRLDDTYQIVKQAYDWTQEHIISFPHEEMRASVEAQLGKDPQKSGGSHVLFASNPHFAKRLEHYVRERWLAAWFYLYNRHSRETFKSDAFLQKELLSLGEIVAQSLSESPNPDHQRIQNDIINLIDELEEIDPPKTKE